MSSKTSLTIPKRHRWVRRVLIGAAAALTAFAVAGFFVAPPVLRRVAASQLGKLLGRRVEVARIRLNPFALALTVEGFTLYEADGVSPFVDFSRLYVNAEWASLFKRAPIIKEVRLESPRIRLVRSARGYNFADILERLAAPAPAPQPATSPGGPPPRFSLNNLTLVDGLIAFDDQPLHAHHEIAGLSVGVPFVSTLPVYLDSFVEPGLRLRLDGTPFEVRGRTKPFKESLDTTLDLRLDALDLTRYVPYLPMQLPFVLASGRLTVAVDLSFVRGADAAPAVKAKGTVALDDVAVTTSPAARGGARPLAAFKRFEVKIAAADLVKQEVHLASVLLDGPDVHVRRLTGGSLDWQELFASRPAASASSSASASRASPKKAATPSRGTEPRFLVDDVHITRGQAHWRDETVRPPFSAAVQSLDFEVKGLSNAPGSQAQVALSLNAGAGGKLSQRGKLGLAPLLADGEVTLEGIQPSAFEPYYRDQLAFAVAKGELGLGATYHFRQGERDHAVSLRLEKAHLNVQDLQLRRAQQDPFFRLAALDVRNSAFDLGERTVEVGSISSREGRLRARRDGHGVVDLTTLLVAAPTSTSTSTSASETRPEVVPAASGARPPEKPWAVTLAELDVQRWGVRFEDQGVSPTAVTTIDPINIHATNLSTVPRSRAAFDVRLGLDKTGRLKLAGAASLTPLSARVGVELASLPILPLQPYFTPFVNLTVTGGALSLKGQATVTAAASATAATAATFDGDIDLTDFGSVERANGEALLAFASFHVGALHLTSAPQAVTIKEVSLTDFRSRLVMYPDAHLNVQDLVAAAPAAHGTSPSSKTEGVSAPKTAATSVVTASVKAPSTTATSASPGASPSASPPLSLSIGQITLQGGHISYQDRLISPPVTAELTELGGRLSSLSTDPRTHADVDLRGALNHSGVLTIVGQANPLARELSLDVKVNVKDFELPPTSPYAAKFAGYGIAKGKLDLSLAYNITNRKLDAKNHLVLDQFTFGDKVESPDAVKLPVKLAVAILKDRHGVIDIDLPITGSLDDPEFKLGRLVLKTLGNLMAKAATAPFSLLASAFGGGDEMSHLAFGSGLATLAPATQERLTTLAKVVRERPGLSFELEGTADPQGDREGLRHFLTERKLKARKLDELVKQGLPVASLDAVTLAAEERSLYLDQAYKVATFPKPRNTLGQEKTLTPEEQERLLLTNTPVTDDELRALALRRATAVQTALTRLVPEGAARIFLVTPRLATPGREVECKIKKD